MKALSDLILGWEELANSPIIDPMCRRVYLTCAEQAASLLSNVGQAAEPATQSTHSEHCYKFGPKHYECALRRIEKLEEADDKVLVSRELLRDASAWMLRQNCPHCDEGLESYDCYCIDCLKITTKFDALAASAAPSAAAEPARAVAQMIGVTRDDVESCRKSFDAYVSGPGYIACRLAEHYLAADAAHPQGAADEMGKARTASSVELGVAKD